MDQNSELTALRQENEKIYNSWITLEVQYEKTDAALTAAQEQIARLERHNRQLVEALRCWPLKEVLSLARQSGNERVAMLFEEVADAALAAPEADQPKGDGK